MQSHKLSDDILELKLKLLRRLPDGFPNPEPRKPAFHPREKQDSSPPFLPFARLTPRLPNAESAAEHQDPVKDWYRPSSSATRWPRHNPFNCPTLTKFVCTDPVYAPARDQTSSSGTTETLRGQESDEPNFVFTDHHHLTLSSETLTKFHMQMQVDESMHLPGAPEPKLPSNKRLSILYWLLKIGKTKLHILSEQMKEAEKTGIRFIVKEIHWQTIRYVGRYCKDIKKLEKVRKLEKRKRSKEPVSSSPTLPQAFSAPNDPMDGEAMDDAPAWLLVPDSTDISPINNDNEHSSDGDFIDVPLTCLRPSDSTNINSITIDVEYDSEVSPFSSPRLRPKNRGLDPILSAQLIGVTKSKEGQSRDFLWKRWEQKNARFEARMLRRREKERPLLILGGKGRYGDKSPSYSVRIEFGEVKW